MSTVPLPCPFCGSCSIGAYDGSTFRWLAARCNECGATAGEVRINTLIPRDEAWPQANEDALQEWNRRAQSEAIADSVRRLLALHPHVSFEGEPVHEQLSVLVDLVETNYAKLPQPDQSVWHTATTTTTQPQPQPESVRELTVVEIMRLWADAKDSIVDFARAVLAAKGKP